ncbi:MAG: CRISPR-associated endonuclease Cas2 [Candidatus Bruticola sp.]
MSKLMRMLVFFDLPVKTKAQRRAATQFRNFLLKDGYYMVQFSVYARICSNFDSVYAHEARLNKALPKRGLVRLLTITEKQYLSSKILVGSSSYYDQSNQLEEF